MRLIPAHAGKTILPKVLGVRSPAHPRSRGENLSPMSTENRFSGSSPLTRGKPNVCNADCQGRRLIPAHAGKTITVAVSLWGILAHPRSRGENDLVTRFFQGRPGSSPLTRGKRRDTGDGYDGAGLIPAHAGKTTVADSRAERTWAHPRSRGENLFPITPLRLTEGSSPLTRGKRARTVLGVAVPRLIPAHAGKTQSAPPTASPNPAHPRSRGENSGRSYR